jgi:hypothetical protein
MSDDLALPGFESLVAPLNARPGDVDMRDQKVYTAEHIFRQHPNVFKAAARLLFVNGLSERSVAAALMLSVNSVRAIRNMALEANAHGDSAAAAFFIKSKAAQSRKLLQIKALEAIQDRLEDAEKLKEISLAELISVVKTVDTLDGDGKTAREKVQTGDAEVVDIEVFDSVLDGLNAGKNPRGEELASGDQGLSVESCTNLGQDAGKNVPRGAKNNG